MKITKEQQIALGIGGVVAVAVIGGTAYYFLTKPKPRPVCTEGVSKCVGYNKYRCRNGVFVLEEKNSSECGYEPPEDGVIPDACIGVTCDNTCIGYDLYSQKCVNGVCVTDTLIKTNSSDCGYEPSEQEICEAEGGVWKPKYCFPTAIGTTCLPAFCMKIVKLKGRVINTQRYPVEGATIQLIDRNTLKISKTTSDANGYFTISLPADTTFDFQINHPDYTPVILYNVSEMMGYPDGFSVLENTYGEEKGTYNMGNWYTTLSDIPLNTTTTNISNPQTNETLTGTVRVAGCIQQQVYDSETHYYRNSSNFNVRLYKDGSEIKTLVSEGYYLSTVFPRIFDKEWDTTTVENGDYVLSLCIGTFWYENNTYKQKFIWDYQTIPITVRNG